MFRVRYAILLLTVSLFVTVAAFPVNGQDRPRRVLLLHSFEAEFAPFDTFAGAFRTELARQAGVPIDFFDVSLQPARFREPPEPAPIINYLQSLFSGHPLDLIVPIGGPAVSFVQQHRDQLFPATPTLFAAVDQRLLDPDRLTPDDAVVSVVNDPGQIVNGILRLLPDTSQLLVVAGASPLERFWREEVGRDLRVFADRLTITWSDELSFDDLLTRVRSLPPHSAILYVLWSVDGAGVPYTEAEALAGLHAASRAPIFGVHSTQIGRGVVGGVVMDIDRLSRTAADVAARILRGQPTMAMPTTAQVAGKAVFDARELARWGIPESRLPPGSEVRFRVPSVWVQYRWLLLGGVSVAVVEALLIAALLVNRRKRVNAEAALERLSRSLLRSGDEQRVQLAHELTDDVCQRIAAASIRLRLLTLKASPDAAGPTGSIAQELEELLARLSALAGQLHASTLEVLGLPKAVEAFARQLSSDSGIRIDVTATGQFDELARDTTLVLFRAVEEALQNVRHSGSDVAVVTLVGRDDDVCLTVTDTGCGFDVHRAMRQGRGLLAMRERVRFLGGTLSIESDAGAGTTVRVVVPRDAQATEGQESEAETVA